MRTNAIFYVQTNGEQIKMKDPSISDTVGVLAKHMSADLFEEFSYVASDHRWFLYFVCVFVCVRACVRAFARLRTCVRACAHASIRACILVRVRAGVRACLLVYVRLCACMLVRAGARLYMCVESLV